MEMQLRPVTTRGEDAAGFIMHAQYLVPGEADEDESLSAFAAFYHTPKNHPDAVNPKVRHFVPLGKTYAAGWGEACCVILSHPPVRRKLASMAIPRMIVRSGSDPFTRVTVEIPEWAKEGAR
jgi:hypothetical protein